ncbi:retinol dehydrogenase 12-like [Saccostrea echinata]|uniref:retinol dehydrogenase 12-like n=1 Tax=Saccostrea echinata TaxID=191078 RepID=UPI002A80B8FB|nr:retinol dehydrogenase 12-like [Saccostrea echinata]
MGGALSRTGFSSGKSKYHSSKSLTGKTIIITGANTGIGFQTALDLARRNGRIILACRNKEKGEAAKSRIIQLTGNKSVVFRHLDVSLMSSVRTFVDVIRREEKGVDILINNAGVVNWNEVFTAEGLEETFATNYYGPFLLTKLLIDILEKSSEGRIVNVGSIASLGGSVDGDTVWVHRGFTKEEYNNSKLALLLFTKELARRTAHKDILVSYVHPGTVTSELFRNLPWIIQFIITFVMRPFLKTPLEGAQSVLFCALDDSVQTGGYYMDCSLYDHSMWVPNSAYDKKLSKKLWETTERIIAEIDSG